MNCWPSVENDFLAINDLLAPFLTAGFYYKLLCGQRAFGRPFRNHQKGCGAWFSKYLNLTQMNMIKVFTL